MHAEKREGQGRQNNGGAFPGSQANSESSLNMFQKLLSFLPPNLKLSQCGKISFIAIDDGQT